MISFYLYDFLPGISGPSRRWQWVSDLQLHPVCDFQRLGHLSQRHGTGVGAVDAHHGVAHAENVAPLGPAAYAQGRDLWQGSRGCVAAGADAGAYFATLRHLYTKSGAASLDQLHEGGPVQRRLVVGGRRLQGERGTGRGLRRRAAGGGGGHSKLLVQGVIDVILVAPAAAAAAVPVVVMLIVVIVLPPNIAGGFVALLALLPVVAVALVQASQAPDGLPELHLDAFIHSTSLESAPILFF